MHRIKILYDTSEHVESSHARAKEIENGQIIKMCKVSSVSPSDFMHEVRVANRASKHGIGPKVKAFGFRDQIGFIRMERLHKSLAHLIATDRLTNKHVDSLKKVLKIMWKRSNFVHMDLHGDNVWFTERGDARLIDFGKTVSNTVLCNCTHNAPYILHADFDDPKIINGQTALVNSCFDIFDRINLALSKSKDKKKLLRLQELLQGKWMVHK